MRVLVTDAENKNALAAMRSLSRRGVTVLAGSARRFARGFLSKNSSHAVTYRSPSDEEAFVSSLLELARVHAIDVVLPVGDACNRVASKHLQRFDGQVAIPVAAWDVMEIASSKELTIPFAAEHGVPVPRTFSEPAAVDSFPVVVKRSLGAGGVRYVNSEAELSAIGVDGAVIQEWIPGEGYGFFAVFDRGVEKAIFMHKRIREYPVTGGASTVAESIFDEELARLGLSLLRALRWHGLAMVEFKRDSRDGVYKLMEINPKLWGSLDLSLAAGVDFPWAAIELAQGRLEPSFVDYPRGLRFQWVFDDFLHVAAQPSSRREFWHDLRNPAVAKDIDRRDLRPAMFDAAKTAAVIARRAWSGTLRRPHGELEAGVRA